MRDLDRVVRAAAAGDAQAWESLFATFTPVVRSVAGRHRLSSADQEEVIQNTWLALVRHIGDVREPAALAGWLTTTARNQSIRVLRDVARVNPVDEVPEAGHSRVEDTFAEEVDRKDRRAAVRDAIERVPAVHRPLLAALIAEPERTYTEVSRELRMPVGSIGPTRARCVARLRRDPAVAGLMDDFTPPPRPTRPSRPPVEVF